MKMELTKILYLNEKKGEDHDIRGEVFRICQFMAYLLTLTVFQYKSSAER